MCPEYSKQFMYSNIVFTEIYDRRAITIVPILLMKKLRKSEISSSKSFSRVQLLATPRTAAYQASLSMGFSRQEYWSGVSLLSPMTNLDSILKSKDITLPTKVHVVKTMVFPVVTMAPHSSTLT